MLLCVFYLRYRESRHTDEWAVQDEANNGYTKIPLVKTFENGTAIPPGQYRIVVRALRVTGDPQKASDYESWLSPIIGVL